LKSKPQARRPFTDAAPELSGAMLYLDSGAGEVKRYTLYTLNLTPYTLRPTLILTPWNPPRTNWVLHPATISNTFHLSPYTL